jgi:hypothetical protein
MQHSQQLMVGNPLFFICAVPEASPKATRILSVREPNTPANLNAMAESFLASLEREVLDRRRFKSQA